MLRALLRHDGVTVPVAAAVMLFMTIFIVAFYSLALNTHDSAREDRSSKRALAAAEAGLQTAVYRLNQIGTALPADSCLTDVAVAPVAGECPGQTDGLGNGAEYTYYVTPELGAATADGCVSLPGQADGATDRCITSVGTVNGVDRRIQARVAVSQEPGFAGFGAAGLIGKSLIYANNSIKLNTDIGSNVLVELNNSVQVNGSLEVDGAVKLLQGGTYYYGNSVAVAGGTQTVTTPFALPQVDFEAPENTNDNAAITTSAFNQTTRRFNLASGTYTIPPGTYHFCDMFLGDGVNFRLTGPTRIYIDSPLRGADSPCSGSDGKFGADNSVKINVECCKRSDWLEIYMYGTSANDTRSPYSWCSVQSSPVLPGECRSDFMLDNSVEFWGSVYAPNSTVQAHNSVRLYGGVAADKVRFFNSVEFTVTAAVRNKEWPAAGIGPADRKGWTECRPEPAVAGDPESGC